MKADFSKIIRDSITVTKTNKRLWVFGLVLASLGTGTNFSSMSNLGDTFNRTERKQPNVKLEQTAPTNLNDKMLLDSNLLTSNLPQILGSSTTSITELMKTVPYTFYAAVIVLILITAVTFTAVSLYAQAWARSGLIHGIDRENAGESLTLNQMSNKGKGNAMEVVKLSIFPGFAFIVAIILGTLMMIIPGLLLGTAGKVLLILGGIIWILAILIASIALGASINLGGIAINLESLKWKEGFSRGFKLFKKFLVDYFVMSIINCFAGCVIGLVILIGLLVLGGIGVAAVLGAVAFPPFMVAAGPIAFLALLAIIMFMGLIGTISIVFTQSTWVLLYKQLTEENNGQQ